MKKIQNKYHTCAFLVMTHHAMMLTVYAHVRTQFSTVGCCALLLTSAQECAQDAPETHKQTPINAHINNNDDCHMMTNLIPCIINAPPDAAAPAPPAPPSPVDVSSTLGYPNALQPMHPIHVCAVCERPPPRSSVLIPLHHLLGMHPLADCCLHVLMQIAVVLRGVGCPLHLYVLLLLIQAVGDDV